MTHRTILKALHTSNPCSVGLVCPACGQDHWLLAQPSLQRNCAKGKCVVYCTKCSNISNPLTKPSSGSIHNDCFKPEALAKLSSLELAGVADNLRRRLWRYNNDLKIIRDEAPRLKRLGLIKATEAVLKTVISLPLYKQPSQPSQPTQSSAAYKADVLRRLEAAKGTAMEGFYKKLLKDNEK